MMSFTKAGIPIYISYLILVLLTVYLGGILKTNK